VDGNSSIMLILSQRILTTTTDFNMSVLPILCYFIRSLRVLSANHRSCVLILIDEYYLLIRQHAKLLLINQALSLELL
jgi:phosphoglycerol transferase MdoB-like AlkP superfamily enzyme